MLHSFLVAIVVAAVLFKSNLHDLLVINNYMFYHLLCTYLNIMMIGIQLCLLRSVWLLSLSNIFFATLLFLLFARNFSDLSQVTIVNSAKRVSFIYFNWVMVCANFNTVIYYLHNLSQSLCCKVKIVLLELQTWFGGFPVLRKCYQLLLSMRYTTLIWSCSLA